jgi:aspartate/glutamate racemase
MKLRFDDHDSLLIWLYVEISDLFSQSELALYTTRFSPNRVAFFTDAELFTCGIFAELVRSQDKKAGYDYIKEHYHDWFPALPSYEVYTRKLNKYYQALAFIYKAIRRKYGDPNQALAMIDTAPIEVCQAQHAQKSKAAQPFVSKGYCAAKKKYYIGAKLQLVAQGRAHQLPFPMEFALASASIHDLEIAKETLPDSELENLDLYGDKAYQGKRFQLELFESKGINLITPIKKRKGQTHLMLFQQAANSIHSSTRQPIDTLFGWIHKKTGIQNASNVRSQNGLFYHVSSKMLAALIMMIAKF